MISIRALSSFIISMCFSSIGHTQSLVARENNAFAFDFYKQCSYQESGNVFISPFSLSSALAMIYPGAAGKTAEEMQAALGFQKNVSKQNEQFSYLFRDLTPAGSPFLMTNTAWIQTGFPFNQQFLADNKTYFGSGLKEVDFADSENVRKLINAEVEKQTHDKIKDLLPPESIDKNVKLVLTNAIYFKDSWKKPFREALSAEGNFYSQLKVPTKAMFMNHHEKFEGYDDEMVSILQLPYKNENYRMTILLPKGSLEAVELNYLNNDKYTTWRGNNVIFKKVSIPRFKIEFKIKPIPILKQFGMNDAFDENKSDFSGISSEFQLFISGIFHKAFVEVNEEGTEAAAATAVVSSIRSMPPPEVDFIADHPFIFVIHEVSTQSVLFIGKLVSP